MNGHDLLWALLLLSCVSLAGLVISFMLVSRSQKMKAKRDARMAAVSSPRARTARVEVTAIARPAETKNQSSLASIAAIFGCHLGKLEQYPVQWWIVLLVALVVAKVAQSLAYGLLGTISYGAIPVVWVFLSRQVFGWAEARRKTKLLNQFPDALAMIVRSVRVGIPVLEAMRAVSREGPAPTGPEFARMLDQISIGVPLDEAVLEMAARADIPEYRFFATTLSLQSQTGGALSEPFENLADMIRKRIALIAKGNAMASEAKTCAIVLGALPVFTGCALWAMSPDYFAVLFNDPTGKILFGTAVLSLCMGMGMIRILIRKSLS